MTSGRWKQDPTSWRTVPRPIGWKKITEAIKARDGQRCVWIENGQRCPTTTGLEVDHIGDPHDDSHENLRTLCGPHHGSKTGRDARAVQLARRAGPPQRPHPGLL